MCFSFPRAGCVVSLSHTTPPYAPVPCLFISSLLGSWGPASLSLPLAAPAGSSGDCLTEGLLQGEDRRWHPLLLPTLAPRAPEGLGADRATAPMWRLPSEWGFEGSGFPQPVLTL